MYIYIIPSIAEAYIGARATSLQVFFKIQIQHFEVSQNSEFFLDVANDAFYQRRKSQREIHYIFVYKK